MVVRRGGVSYPGVIQYYRTVTDCRRIPQCVASWNIALKGRGGFTRLHDLNSIPCPPRTPAASSPTMPCPAVPCPSARERDTPRRALLKVHCTCDTRATTLAASQSLSASRAGMTGARGRSASPTRRNKVAGSSQPSFPGSAPLHRSTTSVTRRLRRYFLLSASRSSAVVRGLGVSVSRCLGVSVLLICAYLPLNRVPPPPPPPPPL